MLLLFGPSAWFRERKETCCDGDTNLHGHSKLLQPLLLQLFGLEEELKAALALIVSEVESVGPLQEENRSEFRKELDRWRQRDAKQGRG